MWSARSGGWGQRGVMSRVGVGWWVGSERAGRWGSWRGGGWSQRAGDGWS